MTRDERINEAIAVLLGPSRLDSPDRSAIAALLREWPEAERVAIVVELQAIYCGIRDSVPANVAMRYLVRLEKLITRLTPPAPVVWLDGGCNLVAEVGEYSLFVQLKGPRFERPYFWAIYHTSDGAPVSSGDAEGINGAKADCQRALRELLRGAT